tara:strand:- start:618 stop:851 length:234 start_codon:yes stop_codon:yes gene_type:complete
MSVWSSAQSLEVVPDVAAFGPLGQRSDVVYFVGRSAAADAVIVEGLTDRVDREVLLAKSSPASVTAGMRRALPGWTA